MEDLFDSRTIKGFRQKLLQNTSKVLKYPSYEDDFNFSDLCIVRGMPSIQRQLNLYGFRCTNRADDKGVYHHSQFVRGEYDVVRTIRRKRTWPTKKSADSAGQRLNKKLKNKACKPEETSEINASASVFVDFSRELSKDLFDDLPEVDDCTLLDFIETSNKCFWPAEQFEQLDDVDHFDWFPCTEL
jgi:hypothetical protein